MAFVHDFRAGVIPLLRAEAKRQGFLVALGDIGFEDASRAVRMVAVKGGVGLLTVEQREEVFERVPNLIWNAYEDGLRWIAQDERVIARDPVAAYSAVVKKCRDPEKMKWIFAAVSPVYRAHLLGRK